MLVHIHSMTSQRPVFFLIEASAMYSTELQVLPLICPNTLCNLDPPLNKQLLKVELSTETKPTI